MDAGPGSVALPKKDGAAKKHVDFELAGSINDEGLSCLNDDLVSENDSFSCDSDEESKSGQKLTPNEAIRRQVLEFLDQNNDVEKKENETSNGELKVVRKISYGPSQPTCFKDFCTDQSAASEMKSNAESSPVMAFSTPATPSHFNPKS